MVDNGRIHKKIKVFSRCYSNSIKSDKKLRQEISDYIERELHYESTESKIPQFGSRFAEKSRSKIKIEKSITKREKTENLSKI